MRNVNYSFSQAVEKTSSAFMLSWLIVSLAFPVQVQAASSGQLLQNAALVNVVYSISRVNHAMRDAANNPMDDTRRENVRLAIAAMPAAIVGLAGEFKSGKLQNSDFPMVQSMLGSFVDMNATDNYKKFMQSPDASLIPQVGAGVAHMMSAPSQSGSGSVKNLGYDESRDGGRSVQADGATIGKDSVTSPEVVPSGVFDVSRGISSTKASSANGNATSNRIEFDDSVGGAEADIIGEIKDNGAAGQAALGEATADLASVAGPSALSIESKEDKEGEEKSALDKDFFTKKKKATKEVRRRRSQVQFKGIRLGALSEKISSWLIPQAHAEGGGGGDPAAVLLGLAAVLASVSAVAIAGMQASADKDIAKTQANAQLQMTAITAQNSEKLAAMQQQTAVQQANTAAQVAAQNNQGVTQRLNMQLAELRSAREEAAQAERERIALENQYNERRIALAEKQAEQSLQLAQATLNAQLTQAGLATGNSGGLSVASSNGSVASTGSVGNAISNLGSNSNAGTGLGFANNSQVTVQATTARGLASVSQVSEISQPAQAASGERLIASLGSASVRGIQASSGVFDGIGASEEEKEEEVIDGVRVKSVKAAKRGALSASASRGMVSNVAAESSLLTAVRNRPDALIAGGSSRGMRATSGAVSRGDISSFIGNGSEGQGFAAFRRHEAAPVVADVDGSGHAK